MIFWEKEQRDVFVNTALTQFSWVPCAFIVLIAEETGASPHLICKVSWRHVDFESNKVKIGRFNYTLSNKVFGLLRQQKERLGFQAKAFPIFRRGSLQWGVMGKKELVKEFNKVKRKASLPSNLSPDTLRISIFKDRINAGQLPTDVCKQMRMSLEEFETFWRKINV